MGFKIIWPIVLASLNLVTATAIAKNPVHVKIDSGELIGHSLSSGVRAWQGVPFAKSPPVRFMPPEDVEKWSSPLNATKSSASCIQQFNYPEGTRNLSIKLWGSPEPIESEDCLYLNVWAPSKKAPKDGWPVMYWIYGGNFQFGHAGSPVYSGEHIAKNHDVVVVGANYRTNVFGFSGSPGIPLKKRNAGLLDQRKSLDWVQKNIKSFDGNPSKVLIFGESAGGYSVKQLVASPPRNPPPFYAALMQSEATGVRNNDKDIHQLAKFLGCPVYPNATVEAEFDCLSKAPAKEIKNILEHKVLTFGPVEDGATFLHDVRESITSGTAAKVPIILGTNANEGTNFMETGKAGGASPSDVIGRLAGNPDLGTSAAAVTDVLYGDKSKYPTIESQGAALITSVGFQCGAAVLAQTMVEKGWNVRRYYYDAIFQSQQPFPGAGAWHGSEVANIFGYLDKSQSEMQSLSKSLQSIWADFAKNPEKNISNWPVITTDKMPVKLFTNKTEDIVDASKLDTSCSLIGPMAELQGI